MPELRVTITEKLNELLQRIVDRGLFTSKADLVRFATIAYLKEIGWLPKPEDSADT
ncbi:MAG: hypothetical protein ACETVR_03340 [Candidatus Bathyarchaeia archaeon]